MQMIIFLFAYVACVIDCRRVDWTRNGHPHSQGLIISNPLDLFTDLSYKSLPADPLLLESSAHAGSNPFTALGTLLLVRDSAINSGGLAFASLLSWRPCSAISKIHAHSCMAGDKASCSPIGCFSSTSGTRASLPVVMQDLDYESMFAGKDFYGVLGVQKDASAAKIKQAYRKLSLRCHPDVSTEPDASEKFVKISEAWEILGDDEMRAQYDRFTGSRARAASSASSGSGGPDFGANFNAAAREEQRQRWREDNPMPEDLGDSFGALFNDVVSAVGKAVAGQGDFVTFLDDLGFNEGAELESLLNSRDVEMLKEELESTQWVQKTLDTRIGRLQTDVADAERDLEDFIRTKKRAGIEGAGSMSRSVERDLERDWRRLKERLADAKRLQGDARSREQRIQARIEDLRSGRSQGDYQGSQSGNSGYQSSSGSRSGQIWEIVGGAGRGGIVARTGQALTSPECESRVSIGALIEELELVGERLHYKLYEGAGPAEGWVSLSISGKPLVQKSDKKADSSSGDRSDYQSSARRPSGKDYGIDLDFEDTGSYKPERLGTVEEELEKLKRKMGK